MGITNIRYGLEGKIGRFRGELEAKRAEVKQIETGVNRLSSLHHEIGELEKLVIAAETLIKHDDPNWVSEGIKAIRPYAGEKLFKPGDLGKTALTVLREAGDWMRPRDISRAMLRRIGKDADDRLLLDQTANSVGMYLKKYNGDLVESRGDYAKEWRVIR